MLTLAYLVLGFVVILQRRQTALLREQLDTIAQLGAIGAEQAAIGAEQIAQLADACNALRARIELLEAHAQGRLDWVGRKERA